MYNSIRGNKIKLQDIQVIKRIANSKFEYIQ
jgi:hypothetical protein